MFYDNNLKYITSNINDDYFVDNKTDPLQSSVNLENLFEREELNFLTRAQLVIGDYYRLQMNN